MEPNDDGLQYFYKILGTLRMLKIIPICLQNLPDQILSNAQTFYKTTEEINMWQTVVFKFCLFYQWVRTSCTYFRHPLWPTTRLLLKAFWIYSMFSCAQTMLLPLQPYSLFIDLSLTPFGRVTISQKSLNIPVT